ncbi:MAG TPA: DUF4244 domain-containing protein [Mycobacteriales bacterium]|nr:DUF4244 domain-containing protein [Mycobacteriales bacterium]
MSGFRRSLVSVPRRCVRPLPRRPRGEAGMTTAEYAVGTIAACSFAGLLWAIVHSGPVQQALLGAIIKALHSL